MITFSRNNFFVFAGFIPSVLAALIIVLRKVTYTDKDKKSPQNLKPLKNVGICSLIFNEIWRIDVLKLWNTVTHNITNIIKN